MRVLLLGKKGLLGAEIVHAFKNSKHEFFALGHEDIDIANHNAANGIIKDIKPDIVINSAAFTNVDECEVKKNFVMEVNGFANENLAKLCKSLGAYLVFLSTDYVFDGTKNEGYKEDDQPSPINVYGESKLLGEKLIQQNTDKYFIIRTSWLFGMQGRNFVKTMLETATNQNEIKVVNDQFGKPTYSHDLAQGIFDFINNDELKPSGIYHLVNEEPTSWYEFAKEIFKQKGLDTNVIPTTSAEISRPAKRPFNSVLLNTKLPHLRSHKEALRDYLKLL